MYQCQLASVATPMYASGWLAGIREESSVCPVSQSKITARDQSHSLRVLSVSDIYVVQHQNKMWIKSSFVVLVFCVCSHI